MSKQIEQVGSACKRSEGAVGSRASVSEGVRRAGLDQLRCTSSRDAEARHADGEYEHVRTFSTQLEVLIGNAEAVLGSRAYDWRGDLSLSAQRRAG